MKTVLLFISPLLAVIFSTASATSIRQENGILLSGTAGKIGWTKKFITVDKEAAIALFDLLSKISTVKQDGEGGLWNYSVKSEAISCRREQTLIQYTDPDEYQVATSCVIEIPYGIIAYLHRTKGDPKQFYIKTSSPELLKALQKNPDTKVEPNGQSKKYIYANGAIWCEDSIDGVVCELTESVK